MKDLLSKQVLLIEDDVELAEVLVAYFRQKGIQVTHFESPVKAHECMTSGEVQFDAVISDLNLPELSGLDFLKKLHSEDRMVPVILITSSNNVDLAAEAIEAGAYDFVVKPLYFPQLFIALQRAFHFSKLNSDNMTLKHAIGLSRGHGMEGIIAHSDSFRKVLDLAKRVSNSAATVLIFGESGSGKEIIARAIHGMSPRKEKSFIAINCSAIPENLLESELFGHTKGAFTGATDKKSGLFEEAEGGTLFLDEIGDMNIQLQAKLLRVLQERKIKRIGENHFRDIDVRIITATHKDLRVEVNEHRFRDDLFFRLNVVPLRVPPLRERKEDILPLAEFFLKKFNALNGSHIKGFSVSAKEYLLNQHWRGNVRELENSIERAVVLCADNLIDIDVFTSFEMPFERNEEGDGGESGDNVFMFKCSDRFAPLEEVERRYIQHVYEKNNRAKESTAKILGIDRKTLYRRLQEQGTRPH